MRALTPKIAYWILPEILKGADKTNILTRYYN